MIIKYKNIEKLLKSNIDKETLESTKLVYNKFKDLNMNPSSIWYRTNFNTVVLKYRKRRRAVSITIQNNYINFETFNEIELNNDINDEEDRKHIYKRIEHLTEQEQKIKVQKEIDNDFINEIRSRPSNYNWVINLVIFIIWFTFLVFIVMKGSNFLNG